MKLDVTIITDWFLLQRYADLLEDVPVRPNEYSEQVPKTPTDSYGQCNCKVESLSDKTELWSKLKFPLSKKVNMP